MHGVVEVTTDPVQSEHETLVAESVEHRTGMATKKYIFLLTQAVVLRQNVENVKTTAVLQNFPERRPRTLQNVQLAANLKQLIHFILKHIFGCTA